jgi:succinate dehydrogenase / fumarate reductase iron-sulfur subunit
MQDFEVDTGGKDVMVLDVLERSRPAGPDGHLSPLLPRGRLRLRRLNINGKNGLACITPLSER